MSKGAPPGSPGNPAPESLGTQPPGWQQITGAWSRFVAFVLRRLTAPSFRQRFGRFAESALKHTLAPLLGAYFFSRFLASLTGGALWVPGEWRSVITIMGLIGGLSLYRLARLTVDRRFPPELGDPDPQVTRAARRKRRRVQSKELEAAWFAAGRAVLFTGLAVAVMGLQGVLRKEVVHPWEPTDALFCGAFSDSPDCCIGAEEPHRCASVVDVARLEIPVFFATNDAPLRGSFLFPVGFPSTPEGEVFVAEVRAAYPSKDLRAAALLHRTIDLVDLVRGAERRALGATMFAFLLLHMAALGLASLAYSYSFTLGEELLMELTG